MSTSKSDEEDDDKKPAAIPKLSPRRQSNAQSWKDTELVTFDENHILPIAKKSAKKAKKKRKHE
jgi:hypothetical protein